MLPEDSAKNNANDSASPQGNAYSITPPHLPDVPEQHISTPNPPYPAHEYLAQEYPAQEYPAPTPMQAYPAPAPAPAPTQPASPYMPPQSTLSTPYPYAPPSTSQPFPSPYAAAPVPIYPKDAGQGWSIASVIVGPLFGFHIIGMILGIVGEKKSKESGHSGTFGRVAWIINLVLLLIIVVIFFGILIFSLAYEL